MITYGYDYLENKKDNSFRRYSLYHINGNFRGSLATGDLDNDRDADVIIGENNFDNNNAIRLYFNNFCKPSFNYKIIDICAGDSLYIDGVYIKQNGFYAYDTIANSKGCDSILGKYVVFHKCIKDYIDTTICSSDYNTIIHCDTTFYNDNDSIFKSMKVVCHRTLYKICETTDINDLNYHRDQLFNAFPNPSKDMVYINDPSLIRFELFDMNGRLLVQSEGKSEVQLNGYNAGVYILKLYLKDGLVKSIKLVKE